VPTLRYVHNTSSVTDRRYFDNIATYNFIYNLGNQFVFNNLLHCPVACVCRCLSCLRPESAKKYGTEPYKRSTNIKQIWGHSKITLQILLMLDGLWGTRSDLFKKARGPSFKIKSTRTFFYITITNSQSIVFLPIVLFSIYYYYICPFCH